MTKVNICLTLILILCAFGVVTSQHEARKLFVALEGEREIAHQLDVEWGRLQLEQSTLATHGRVESIAREKLAMEMPVATRMRFVKPAHFVSLADTDGMLAP